MKRREFVKAVPLTAMLPAALSAKGARAQATQTQTAATESAAAQSQATPETFGLPDYAGKILHSDMDGVGPDGWC